MIIEIRDPLLGSGPEWILLELQGKLSSAAGAGFDGLVIGHVRSASDGRLLLQVGTHVVEGKLASLDRALHVLQRQPESAGGAPSFVVTCVVRRKLLCTDRPEALISATGPGRP